MAKLSVAEVLERAADLIEPEGAWTQGANARDGEGRKTYATGEDAVCFCAAGAILHVGGGVYPIEHVKAVLPDPGDTRDWLVAFNDAPERTQAEVVSKLREAAAARRATLRDGGRK